MGTVRMMMMATVAIGAGAFLALSTIPAFAPYQDRKPDRSAPLVTLPERETQGTAPQEPTYGLALPSERESSDDSFHLDSRGGALVVELPRWAQDGGAWLNLGRQAWRDWVEPYEGSAADDRDYAPRRHRDWDERDEAAQGYARRPERSLREDEDEADSAGGSDSWSEPVEAAPRRASRYADEAPTDDDSAALAAARARDAARDVGTAEDAGQ